MTHREPSAAPQAGSAGAGGAERQGVGLWISPRASRDAVAGEHDGLVAIRLQAPPVDGAANEALIRFLARRLGCPARSVQLLRGHTGRRKWVAVSGLSAGELRRRLLDGASA